MLEKSSNFQINGGTFVEISGNKSGFDRLCKKTITAASYDSYAVAEYKAGCMEGTRTQYVTDITSWAANVSQTHPQRLLWLYGPAGVGKSAVAKSCATETARIGHLGASFFFSRDNGVVNPADFFTTLACQIAIHVPEYKRAVSAKIEADPTLLDKGLEKQFQELIITPFLELQNQQISLVQRAIFIDGLDECNGNPAQSKIIDLIIKSVVTHGKGIPLLWAFFSRPERHIDDVFSRHIESLIVWSIHLQVSRDYDNDIRLYFRNSLQLRTSIDDIYPPLPPPSWPSEEDLESLVAMVAGLFIYAATVVRFIMDESAVNPRRQLRDVLEFHSHLQESSTQPSSRPPSLTSELDAFYSLIMDRIPPQHLLLTQRILLSVRTIPKHSLRIRIPAIILDITLSDLRNSLSKLRSVLELRPGRPRWPSEDRRWPGSGTIYFYHASFMEFLCDRERSREYCIHDARHYSFLVARGMYLVKEMYQMNGLSREDRIYKLRKLLSVLPQESSNPETCLNFQNQLLYDFLCVDTMPWFVHSGDSLEASEAIRTTAEVLNLSWFFVAREETKSQLSEESRQLIESHRLRRRRWPTLPALAMNVQNAKSSNVRVRRNVLAASIISILDGSETLSGFHELTGKLASLIDEACKSRRLSEYIRSKLTITFSSGAQVALLRAKEVDLDALTDVELLDYYSCEWFDDDSRLLALEYLSMVEAPQTFSSAIESPWIDFFVFVEGDTCRLTRAVCRLLTRRRSGDLIPFLGPTAYLPGFLKAFTDTAYYMKKGGSDSRLTRIQTELQQVTEAHYRAKRSIILADPPTSYLNRVASLIRAERYIFRHGLYSSELAPVTMGVCTEVLMEDHWPVLLGKVREALASGNDPDDSLGDMRDIIQCSRQPDSRFQHILREHIQNVTQNAINKWGRDEVPYEKIRACVSTLLDVKEHQYERVEEALKYDDTGHFRHVADEAFHEVLDRHPVWHHAVNEVLAEQEGEVLRALFSTNTDSEVGSHDSSSQAQLGKQSLLPLESNLHASRGGPSNSVDNQILSSSSRDTKGEEVVGCNDNDSASSGAQMYRATELIVTNQKAGAEKARKRERLAKTFRRIFKRS